MRFLFCTTWFSRLDFLSIQLWLLCFVVKRALKRFPAFTSSTWLWLTYCFWLLFLSGQPIILTDMTGSLDLWCAKCLVLSWPWTCLQAFFLSPVWVLIGTNLSSIPFCPKEEIPGKHHIQFPWFGVWPVWPHCQHFIFEMSDPLIIWGWMLALWLSQQSNMPNGQLGLP